MSPWWQRLRCFFFGHPRPALGVIFPPHRLACFNCKRCGARWTLFLDD